MQRGFTINGEKYTLEQAIYAARQGKPVPPESVLRATFSDRDDNIPSASAIARGLSDWHERKETEDEYPTIESRQAAMFGTAVHAYLTSQESAGTIRETQLTVTLPVLDTEIELTGTPDEIDFVNGYVRDYKTKIYLPVPFEKFYPPKSHIAQANIYGYMWNKSIPDYLYPQVHDWELFYLDQRTNKQFRGPLLPMAVVENRIIEVLTEWLEIERQLNGNRNVPYSVDISERGNSE